jgi:hypothetical protein
MTVCFPSVVSILLLIFAKILFFGALIGLSV